MRTKQTLIVVVFAPRPVPMANLVSPQRTVPAAGAQTWRVSARDVFLATTVFVMMRKPMLIVAVCA